MRGSNMRPAHRRRPSCSIFGARVSQGICQDPLWFDGKSAGLAETLESIGAPHRELGLEVGVGIKAVSYLGTERLVHSAISYAIQHQRKSVTLVHKGTS